MENFAQFLNSLFSGYDSDKMMLMEADEGRRDTMMLMDSGGLG